MTPMSALLLAASFAGQDIGNLPPATPTFYLEGPVNFCAQEFSVRLERGETISWLAPARRVIRYTIRSGDIEASIGRGRDYAPPRRTAMITMTAMRLPLSPLTRRYVEAIPDRTEMNAEGDQHEGYDYAISWFLYGAARTATPFAVSVNWGDRRYEPPFLRRIDPRPLRARGCTLSPSDPALAGRIRHHPGR